MLRAVVGHQDKCDRATAHIPLRVSVARRDAQRSFLLRSSFSKSRCPHCPARSESTLFSRQRFFLYMVMMQLMATLFACRRWLLERRQVWSKPTSSAVACLAKSPGRRLRKASRLWSFQRRAGNCAPC